MLLIAAAGDPAAPEHSAFFGFMGIAAALIFCSTFLS